MTGEVRSTPSPVDPEVPTVSTWEHGINGAGALHAPLSWKASCGPRQSPEVRGDCSGPWFGVMRDLVPPVRMAGGGSAAD